jgi:hypothetical protein
VGKITEEMSVYLNIPLEYEYRKYYENKILWLSNDVWD